MKNWRIGGCRSAFISFISFHSSSSEWAGWRKEVCCGWGCPLRIENGIILKILEWNEKIWWIMEWTMKQRKRKAPFNPPSIHSNSTNQFHFVNWCGMDWLIGEIDLAKAANGTAPFLFFRKKRKERTVPLGRIALQQPTFISSPIRKSELEWMSWFVDWAAPLNLISFVSAMLSTNSIKFTLLL